MRSRGYPLREIMAVQFRDLCINTRCRETTYEYSQKQKHDSNSSGRKKSQKCPRCEISSCKLIMVLPSVALDKESFHLVFIRNVDERSNLTDLFSTTILATIEESRFKFDRSHQETYTHINSSNHDGRTKGPTHKSNENDDGRRTKENKH